MTPLLLVLLAVLIFTGLFFLFARLGNQEAGKVAEGAEELLQELDNRYEEFIETKLLMAAKDQEIDLDLQHLEEEAMIILKPNIEGLLAHVNASKTYGNVKVDYYSRNFKNAVPTVNAYSIKSYQLKNQMLSEQDEEKFIGSFQDAIRSDLKRRVLLLNSGQ